MTMLLCMVNLLKDVEIAHKDVEIAKCEVERMKLEMDIMHRENEIRMYKYTKR